MTGTNRITLEWLQRRIMTTTGLLAQVEIAVSQMHTIRDNSLVITDNRYFHLQPNATALRLAITNMDAARLTLETLDSLLVATVVLLQQPPEGNKQEGGSPSL